MRVRSVRWVVYGGMNYPSVGHFAMLSLGRQGWGHFGFEVGLG